MSGLRSEWQRIKAGAFHPMQAQRLDLGPTLDAFEEHVQKLHRRVTSFELVLGEIKRVGDGADLLHAKAVTTYDDLFARHRDEWFSIDSSQEHVFEGMTEVFRKAREMDREQLDPDDESFSLQWVAMQCTKARANPGTYVQESAPRTYAYNYVIAERTNERGLFRWQEKALRASRERIANLRAMRSWNGGASYWVRDVIELIEQYTPLVQKALIKRWKIRAQLKELNRMVRHIILTIASYASAQQGPQRQGRTLELLARIEDESRTISQLAERVNRGIRRAVANPDFVLPKRLGFQRSSEDRAAEVRQRAENERQEAERQKLMAEEEREAERRLYELSDERTRARNATRAPGSAYGFLGELD